jgi:predicted DNA-binding protein (MmcQ/YjbR family)
LDPRNINLDRIRAICAALPEPSDRAPFGHPMFYSGKHLVASTDNDGLRISVKVPPDLQRSLVERDSRFSVTEYIGRHGWVTLRLDEPVEWGEVEQYTALSHELQAARSGRRQR